MSRVSYGGDGIVVTFDTALCIHATECLQGLPGVFDRQRRPWIDARAATADAISKVVERCPSGALRYRRTDGRPDERPSEVTTVTPRVDGPLVVRGDLLIRTGSGGTDRTPRAALCRCGRSSNGPFCDNSHLLAADLSGADGSPGQDQTPGRGPVG